MSIVALYPEAPAALFRPADDRALGATADVIRSGLIEAMPPPDDRGAEIYQRVARALHRAQSDEGTLVNAGTLSRTFGLLAMLPRNLPLPEVVVESETEVGLDWDEGARRTLTLTVREAPLVGFSALVGDEPIYGRVNVAGEFPAILAHLFARIYPRRYASQYAGRT